MEIYSHTLTTLPVEFDIIVSINRDIIYGDLDFEINGAVDLSDFNLPKGSVISKERKRITQQMINDYECFVSDIEDLCEINYGLELVYDNVSPDHSHYYSYLAKDENGNIVARFRFRLRISNYDAHRTNKQKQNKKQELNSPKLHSLLTENQIKKLRTMSKDIIVNDELYDSYEQAFKDIDDIIERAVEVMTR